MSATRRSFLQSAAATGAGVTGAVSLLAQPPQGIPAGQTPARVQGPEAGQRRPAGPAQPAAPLRAASEIQVPKMKFGAMEISRLVAGSNCFWGYAHYNQMLGTVMSEYYTNERICEVMHQCNRFGINTMATSVQPRLGQVLDRFMAEGGKMNLIVQGQGDPTEFIKKYKPMAVYAHGEMTDRAFQNAQLDTIREWCKKYRDMGVMVGVGTHKPEIIAEVESQGWDVDFYSGCVYNRTRTQEEWKTALGGELVEMQVECYLQSDPALMYKVIRATKKPCFAFKILAAGRAGDADTAFRTAYESIKPTDGVFIGLFPRIKDEVRENAECVHRILAGA